MGYCIAKVELGFALTYHKAQSKNLGKVLLDVRPSRTMMLGVQVVLFMIPMNPHLHPTLHPLFQISKLVLNPFTPSTKASKKGSANCHAHPRHRRP